MSQKRTKPIIMLTRDKNGRFMQYHDEKTEAHWICAYLAFIVTACLIFAAYKYLDYHLDDIENAIIKWLGGHS